MSTLQNPPPTTFQEYKELQRRCDLILSQPKVRFAGIINHLGYLSAGGFKQGIEPFESDPNMRKLYMQLALRVSMRRDFDYSLGKVRYTFSRRDKVVMMSFPLDNKILLVALDPSVNVEEFAPKIMKVLQNF